MPWRDRLIGVVLGLVLGVGLVVVFVFVFSEQTVDAPSITGHDRAGERRGEPRSAGASSRPAPPPVATVRIEGGAPPSSGPADLHYRRGERVRLKLVSDTDLDLELLGYGLGANAIAGDPTTLSFEARKAGDFPLVVAASHIDVARITVEGGGGL